MTGRYVKSGRKRFSLPDLFVSEVDEDRGFDQIED
jgi:hypothetical protein